MSSFIVTSNAALSAALSGAHAGDVIKLAPGGYSAVSIKGLSVGGVTVTSQDLTHEAVLSGLRVDHASGLTFSNLEFSLPVGDGTAVPHGVFVNWSNDIHFQSDSIHGAIGVRPDNAMTGIGISKSSNVSLTGSELQYLHTGLTMGSDTNVVVSGNNFHDIRLDGIEGAAIQNGAVTGNNFSNFHHLLGDHSDAIQFWTTGQKVGSANLTISDNVIVQGQGHDMQGIFIQDLHGAHPYTNLTVTDNLVVGGNWNGIMVDDAHGGVVSGDTVTSLSTQTQKPWIMVKNSNGVSVDHNRAHAFGLATNNSHLVTKANVLTPIVNDQGVAVVTAWLGSHTHVVPMGPNTAMALVHPSVTGNAAAMAVASALPPGTPAGAITDDADTLAQAYTWPDTGLDPLIDGDAPALTAGQLQPPGLPVLTLLGLQAADPAGLHLAG
jgi:nitrous oxidase accessory protein NosD